MTNHIETSLIMKNQAQRQIPTVWHIRDRSCPRAVLYIGRSMPGLLESKYANPYRISKNVTRQQAIDLFRKYAEKKLLAGDWTIEQMQEDFLNGVGCWCAPQPCHGNVLLELAYGGFPEKIDKSLFY